MNAPRYRCETCQEEATIHIEAIGCHFCESCLAKIDARLQRPDLGLCKECDGTGGVDSGGVTPWGSPISLPCPSCHAPELKECAAIGAAWKQDSSLEKWFPITAENLAKPQCTECGGSHEPSGARSDCIRHWKLRALQAENITGVEKHYGGILGAELRQWLNAQDINGNSIGNIRRQCFMPWDSAWNSLVRDETASREKHSV